MKYHSTHSRHSSGIALVITLIFVSITAFLAITFLIVTQRERGSVSVSANQTDARFAADTALERVKAEILAPMLAYNDRTRYGLRVSTNFINARGYFTSLGTGSPRTNVNYDYLSTGVAGSLTPPELQDVMGNLQYNPRVPVYVRSQTNVDFRFYLDLNRNGRFDPNGYVPVLNANHHYVDTNNNELGLAVTNQAPPANARYQFQIGDPEWIGILEHPEWPHSSSNRFIARYAYVVAPIGQTLDINFIHNQAIANTPMDRNNDRYLRNQGVGSWEINLASFFADLNSNIWGNAYLYNQPGSANSGVAFADAFSILNYRYNGDIFSQQSVQIMFPGSGNTAFQTDGIDEYSDGPLQIGVAGIDEKIGPDITTKPWAGADNTNSFFTLQDLFKIDAGLPNGFSNRLYSAGTSNSTFDASTFYRMAAQLGTESSVGTPRMNLNYDNLVQPNAQSKAISATNFIPWAATNFFNNAADRLLSTLPAVYSSYAGKVGITNIPVFQIVVADHKTNFLYTPAIHRLMQVAANLLDATTNRSYKSETNRFLPSVFRPIFSKQTSNNDAYVWISSYEEISNNAVARFNMPWFDAEYIATNTLIKDGVCSSNVYNVPWVVGAKSGLPNFNEFSMLNSVTVSRKLEFVRRDLSLDPNVFNNPVAFTNQLYSLTISNQFADELWNSYKSAWDLAARPLQLILTNEFTLSVTNTNTLGFFSYFTNFIRGTNYSINPGGVWAGYSGAIPAPPPTASFQVPITNSMVVTQANVVCLQSPSGPGFPGLSNRVFVLNAGPYPLPRWQVGLNSHVRYALVDSASGRIVDCVALSKTDYNMDLAWELAGETNDINAVVINSNPNLAWNTNYFSLASGTPPNGPSKGLEFQYLVSMGKVTGQDLVWRDASGRQLSPNEIQHAIDFFTYQFGITNSGSETNVYRTNVFYAPYNPARTAYQPIEWEANDPLVHYIPSDLINPQFPDKPNVDVLPQNTINRTGQNGLNRRFFPWGQRPGTGANPSSYNVALKDPLMYRSDDWQFPTNKFPSIGWMGRVHRGTPWQTLYLKSPLVDFTTWQSNWVYNSFILTNDYPDAATVLPTNDWAFLDLFTAAPNDNADRGRLSVNQTNLAAWSAVLSGVMTLTNTTENYTAIVQPSYAPLIIYPVAAPSPLGIPLRQVVDALNSVRSTNFSGSFKHIGDVFSTPELTVKSPYLNTTALDGPAPEDFDVNDAAMERIPQQIAGLLRNDDPRLVVYAYGQSLKPADQSIIQPQGLCTNYQVTGEVAIRSVVNIISTTNGGFRTEVEKYNFLPPD